jgi:carboxypeptidase Taq
VESIAVAQKRSEQQWRVLRPKNDWNGFAPLLKNLVALQRESAAILGETLECSPYEALMDTYEPGARIARIDSVFAELRAFLPGLIERIIERQDREGIVIPEGPFTTAQQRSLAEVLMKAVGYNFDRGRMDVTYHPFCGGTAIYDVRVTTRYDETDFTKALMAALHETGHAKYQQGLPEKWLGQPVGRSRSMSIHESQSLLQEMQVCRSKEFLTFSAPFIREAFPERAREQPGALEADNLYRVYTRVQPSLIRVDADEVTYPLHVILRYDMEKKLFGGEMEVRDIPEAWDAAMTELLGISTKDDYRDGCMQDVHWPSGIFGYFPSYALGAMSAAQIYAAASRALPGLSDDIARGSFDALNQWQHEKIWNRGSLLSIDDLMKEATGESLDPKHFKRHLLARYLPESD